MSGKIIPEATPIILTAAERAELESLVRSTKTEQRTHFKARNRLWGAPRPARQLGKIARLLTQGRPVDSEKRRGHIGQDVARLDPGPKPGESGRRR
jgi:hypothetical protein